jgi:hypothetical protein
MKLKSLSVLMGRFLEMSGWMNLACRLNDGSTYSLTAHSRNAHDIWCKGRTVIHGDDSGARDYLEWHKDLGTDISSRPLKENEYGVLAVDFVDKIILFNRNDWSLDRDTYFDWKSDFSRAMVEAGRVQLVSPDGSIPTLKMTPSLECDWENLVHDPRHYTREELTKAPFPVDYFLRKPKPYFEYDCSPWSILQFAVNDTEAFMDAFKKKGFMVDRQGWGGGLSRSL